MTALHADAFVIVQSLFNGLLNQGLDLGGAVPLAEACGEYCDCQ